MNEKLLKVIEDERWENRSDNICEEIDPINKFHNEALDRIAEAAKKPSNVPVPEKTTGEFEKSVLTIYNRGYHTGHHDTVEGNYVNILDCDMSNYHEDNFNDITEDVDFITTHNADIAAKDKENEIALANERARIMRGDFNNICAYCGWEADDEHSTWEALQHHVLNCEEHPLFKANKRIAELEAKVEYQSSYVKSRDGAPIGFMRKERADVLQRRIEEYRERIKELEATIKQ